MSLQVWLPLNGDLHNQGASNINITSGTPVYSSSGKIGNASLDFINSTRINMYCEELANASIFSICFWAKSIKDTNDSDWASPISFGAKKIGGSEVTSFRFGKSNAANVAGYPVAVYHNAENVISNSNKAFTTSDDWGKWVHICFTYDGTNIVCYKNGVKVAGDASGQGGVLTGNIYLRMTRSNWFLNDLRVYDHVLSAAEAHEIAQGLILHYKLDDLTNGVLDSSGYGHNGLVTGNLSNSNNSARYNNCIYMPNGQSDYITSQDNVGYFTNGITLNIWFKSTNKSPGSSYHHCFNSLTSWTYIEMAVHSGGFLRCGLYINGTRYVANTDNTNLLDGNWHMLTMTYDGVNVKRYVDGILKSTQAATGNLNTTSDKFIFGHGASTGYYCKEAYLSDARLYVTGLSADDVLTLYHTGARIGNRGDIHTYELNEEFGIEENAKFVNNSATSMTYDAATDTYTIVSPVGTSSWGYGVRLADTPALEVPYGMTYRWTAEVWTPVALTVQTDYNNAATTAWAGNDNDAIATRLAANNAIPANTWTRIYRGTSNTHTSNTNHLSIRDYSSLGLITNGQSESVTWKVRHLQWYLVNTTFKPQIKKTGIIEAEHFTEVEQDLNKPAQFNKQMFSVNGNEFIEF